jgi:diguanylate cyclase (GGDEF)-like protein
VAGDRGAQAGSPVSPGTQPAAAGAVVPGSMGRARTILIGGAIIVMGLGASAVFAAQWRSSGLVANRKAFQSTVEDLSSALAQKLTANVVLTRTIRARATTRTQDGETDFLRWYAELQRGAPPQPDIVATLIQMVPASGLAAFRRQAESDPAFRGLPAASFRVVPAGHRPTYCLTRAIVGTGGSSLYPGLVDYCAPAPAGSAASPYRALVQTATDTGSFIVTTLPPSHGRTLVAIGAAVYREGAPIATVKARRAAVTSFVGTTFDAPGLIQSVLAGHQSLTVALYHTNPGGPAELIGRAGARQASRPAGYVERRNLGEGWLLRVNGTAADPISVDARGFASFGVGLLITILAFLLYRSLAGSRQRAWSLVEEKADELEYRALHDPLTGLPNRTLVLDRAEQMLARARRLNLPVTALLMGIDGFKQLNDRFGRELADEVLQRVGARLDTVLRASDTVGRLGGDEFVMLVDTVGLDVAPELVAERILDVLRQPIEFAETARPAVSMTVSIGIATGLPASAENLLQDADLALAKAKDLGKDGYLLFESAMHTASRDRIHLAMDLAEALRADQLFMVYQPIVELENEQVVGVEALIRWRHPIRGVIPPEVFVPIAEENGEILPIGKWALEQACAQAASWHDRGLRLSLSVNVSARQLERREFAEEVRTTLGDCGLDPGELTLEITETVLMREPEATALLLKELKALGVRIAVDDFGTGYSSLAYLRQFPVDSLKIDRSFITALELSSEGHALTHTLIQLGKALGLQTLAEGVEHRSQIEELQREKCDMAQGFLFARPLTPNALESFLEDRGDARDISSQQLDAPAIA